MRRYFWWWVAIAGGGLAALLLSAVPTAARIWAALLLVPIPLAAARQVALVGDPETLPRRPLYLSSIVSLWVIAFISALAARASGMSADAIGLRPIGMVATLAWAAALTAAGIALLLAARALRIRESALLQRLLPVSTAEKTLFVGLSLTAGFCEELVFRGFLLHTLHIASGSLILAVAVTTAVFGWMHAYQEARGALRAGTLGALLALPVVLSGSVIPSMIAHAAIDILGGILLRKRLVPEMA